MAASLPVRRLFAAPQQPFQPIFYSSAALWSRLSAYYTSSPSLISLHVPSLPALWQSIWEGVLRAVPKKKTSHSKSRMRRLGAGKHLRDLTNLNRCSSCGRVKRMHILCPHCVQNIKDMWAGRLKTVLTGDRAAAKDASSSSSK